MHYGPYFPVVLKVRSFANIRTGRVSLRSALLSFAAVLILKMVLAGAHTRPVTIQDCVEKVRIDQAYDLNDPTFVFSNDGRQFLALTWRGDLKANVNRYTLLLFDTSALAKKPVEIAHASYTYDSRDQHASPLSQMRFLNDKRVAALATLHGGPRQVVYIDTKTKVTTALTRDPRGVLAFGAALDGNALVYAVESKTDGATKKALLTQSGFSLDDRTAIDAIPLLYLLDGDWFNSKWQYFLVHRPGGSAKLIYEGPGSRAIRPNFWVSPDGQSAVVYPYVPVQGESPTLGLINMHTGQIERLLLPGNVLRVDEGSRSQERRIDFGSSSRILWSADSKSLLIFSVGPKQTGALSVLGTILPGADIYELALKTRRTSWAKVGRRYDLIGWNVKEDGILLNRSGREVPAVDSQPSRKQSLAIIRREGNGWGDLSELSGNYDLNQRYYRSTNGRLIVGVKDGLSEPPEIAAYDIEKKSTHRLTDLNPQMRQLAFGEVTRIRWTSLGGQGVGYLIKPVGFVPSKRYPLIIQWKDEYYDPDDNSFILDAQGEEQYNDVAAQVWANSGFMVLLTPAPAFIQALFMPNEGEYTTAHVESALDLLDSQGLIDRSKVAISGWSWSGYQTEYVLAHSRTRFAAAAVTDNVQFNLLGYSLGSNDPRAMAAFGKVWENSFPWGETAQRWRERAIDFKYGQAKTPRLIEVHGTDRVIYSMEAYAALKLLKIPVDFYLYPDAAHSLRSPRHRLNSLATHTDWYRFWLKGEEDSDPSKATQYKRWREMKRQ